MCALTAPGSTIKEITNAYFFAESSRILQSHQKWTFYRYLQVRETSPSVPEGSLRWWWAEGEIKGQVKKGSGRKWSEMFPTEITRSVSMIIWNPPFVLLTFALRHLKNEGCFKDDRKTFPASYSFEGGSWKAKRKGGGTTITCWYILHELISFWPLTPLKCQFSSNS